MSLTNNLAISGDVDQSTINRVYRLLTTPAGSIPFDRNFGIDLSVLDNTPAALEGALLIEYTKKMKTYFPSLVISQITFTATNDSIAPKVVINYV